MRRGPRMASARGVGVLFDVGTTAGLDDATLLDRFADRDGDAAETAFAAIVGRHGPMVLRVCRGVLDVEADALDAFQATFLVLVTRAGSVRRPEALGSWLHGVALRTARAARSAAIRRRDRERAHADGAPTTFEPVIDDRGPIVLEEFAGLPEAFRVPMTLCDIDGMTHDRAATALGWPVGTVKSRLARGRARLRDRLARRGIDRSAPTPMLPPALVDATARSAVRFATSGTVPASTLALIRGVSAMSAKDLAHALIGSAILAGIVAAGLAPAAPDPPHASAPAKTATRPPAPPVDPPMVTTDVRYVDMGGLGWREMGGSRLKAIQFQAPFTVWTTDKAGMRELLTTCQNSQPGSIVQAPTITAIAGERAVVLNETGVRFPISSRVSGRSDGKPAAKVDGRVYRASAKGDIPDDPTAVGVRIEAVGRWVGDGIGLKATIRSTHVVATHETTLPGAIVDGAGATTKPARVTIPEIVRSELTGDWTLARGEWLVISLGVERTVNGSGTSTVTEPLLVIEARQFMPDPEVASPGPRR